jgi:TPR repeat protein
LRGTIILLPEYANHSLQISSIVYLSHEGESVSKDLDKAAYYLKSAVDQGVFETQNNCGNCLQKDEGVGIDFIGTAYYFKLAKDQGFAEG